MSLLARVMVTYLIELNDNLSKKGNFEIWNDTTLIPNQLCGFYKNDNNTIPGSGTAGIMYIHAVGPGHEYLCAMLIMIQTDWVGVMKILGETQYGTGISLVYQAGSNSMHQGHLVNGTGVNIKLEIKFLSFN
jgi:hypothetical protein